MAKKDVWFNPKNFFPTRKKHKVPLPKMRKTKAKPINPKDVS
jgi:hypothetical protein